MPIAIAFQEPDTFMVCASGKVTFEESQLMLDEVLAHPRFGSGAQLLVDGRTVSGAPSAAELRTIATHLVPMLQRGMGPIAIVTDSPMVYGVARMFSTFAELVSATVMPFRSMTDAEQWLAAQAAPRN